MMKIGVAAVTLTTVLAMGGIAQAGSINRREHRQIHRIVNGIRSGELTAREASRLLAEQARIRVEEWRYRRSGGGLSPREYLDLRRDLNRASRHIYRQKHDGQSR